MGSNQSLKKADEWRRLLTITPILLWWSWKNDDDEILNVPPPIPPNATQIPEHSRNPSLIYSAVLLLCVAVRILASREISMTQARLGQTFLTEYIKALLALKVHLVINHHMAMHYLRMIKLFGPVYGWWLFAFERFNGMLEKVKTNGKDGGRSEQTLLRNWLMTHLTYELLLLLPEDAHPRERDMVQLVITTQAQERGSMMAQIAVYQAEARAGED